MQTRRFGKTLKLPSTVAVKHQIRKSMLEDSLKAELRERAEARRPQAPIKVIEARPL